MVISSIGAKLLPGNNFYYNVMNWRTKQFIVLDPHRVLNVARPTPTLIAVCGNDVSIIQIVFVSLPLSSFVLHEL